MKHSFLFRVTRALGLLSLVCCALLADTTVLPQTVGPGQTATVVDTGKVTTTEHVTTIQVQVQLGGKALFVGGTSVVLKPGFRTDSGALFRASRDLNLGGFANLNDIDFDGLPDEWELLHFGTLTTTTGIMDSDGDGFSNSGEYYAGTNPNFNETTVTTLPASVQIVLKTSTGKFQKVMTDWSITLVP